VYHYGSKFREFYYGTHLMKKMRDRWNKSSKYPEILITGHNAYTQSELYEVYKDCFIGVRLTEHDNMALSCVELGLMGRYSIFNGNIPCAINYPCEPYTWNPLHRRQWVWQDESLMGVVGGMILETDREPSKELAEEMKEFVHDNEDWLDTKFYEG
jgi:hypothetical protein